MGRMRYPPQAESFMIAKQMTTHDIAAIADEAVFVLPTTAIEQHGPHLPIGTDFTIAARIVTAAEKQRPNLICLYPAVPFGSSDHHALFAGTLTLRADLYTQVLVDLMEKMIGWGARRIVLINSHGGNMTPGKQALNLVAAKRPTGVWCVMVTYFELCGKTFAGDEPMDTPAISHACEYETSMMQVIAPGNVHLDRYQAHKEPSANNYIGWHDEKPGVVSYGAMTEWISSNGVSGDPRKATADKGEHLLRAATDALVKFIDDFSTWPYPRDLREED